MGKVRRLIHRHALDVLIQFGAVQAALDVALRQDPQRAPVTSIWFAAPAMGLIVLTLLARRRFPFGAPVAVWVGASALSFVDVRAVIHTPAALVAGLAAAFLLGTLRAPVQARIGLAIAAGGVLVIIYNDPSHSVGDLIFTPVQVVIAGLAGWGVRLQATQAEAAEEQAQTAERERESAARFAVAEERARIARELHDIVAHSVSVMVLQVGAVRHRLPAGKAQDKEALQGVEQAGRAALTEMCRLLGAMRQDGQALDLAPQPGLDSLDALVADVQRAGLAVHLDHDGERVPLARAIDLSAYRITPRTAARRDPHRRGRRGPALPGHHKERHQAVHQDPAAHATRRLAGADRARARRLPSQRRRPSNSEIATELFISETTVKTHITHILQKLDLRDRVQAVVMAYQNGLVTRGG